MEPNAYAGIMEANSENGTKVGKTLTIGMALAEVEQGSLGFMVGINSKAIFRIDEIWLES